LTGFYRIILFILFKVASGWEFISKILRTISNLFKTLRLFFLKLSAYRAIISAVFYLQKPKIYLSKAVLKTSLTRMCC